MSTSTVTSLDGFHAAGFAQRADELVRAYFGAVNVEDSARIDALLARSFLSYDVHGTRSRTALKRYHAELRESFSGLRFDVHENVGVLVEADLVALRTIITGTHSGEYAGVAATGNATGDAFATHSPVPPRAAAGCIARIMRKSNRARPTSDAPLLLL
jgi:predicted ester cyclase